MTIEFGGGFEGDGFTFMVWKCERVEIYRRVYQRGYAEISRGWQKKRENVGNELSKSFRLTTTRITVTWAGNGHVER